MSALLENLPRPVALVCGAGGANCMSQAGMLEPLFAEGWRPDIVLGSSGGAIAAAATRSPDAAATATAAWQDIAGSKLVKISWARLAAVAAPGDNTRLARQWRELLVCTFADQVFDADGTTGVVATSLTSSAPVVITDGPVVDGILAAAAFPAVAPPVERDSHLLVDGSFAAPLPVWQALQLGAASIVALDTGRSDADEAPSAPSRWFDVVLASTRFQMAAKASHDLADAAERVPVVALSCPEPFRVGWTDLDERLAAGRARAAEQLADLARTWDTFSDPGVYTTSREVLMDKRLLEVLR